MNTHDQINERINHLRYVNQKINAAVRIFDSNEIELLPFQSLPLHAVVFSVKECFQVKGEPIFLGSAITTAYVPDEDAEIVKVLKRLGAVLVARGNLSEFMTSFETTNLKYGRTNNPLNILYTAGGSSGGDAALVAAGAVDFAIVSDIGGSVRVPSAFCGVVGFKAAADDLSIEGFYPRVNHFAESMLGIGLITKKVALCRTIYENLKGIKFSNVSNNAPLNIIPLHPFIDGVKDAVTCYALADSVTYFENSPEFTIKQAHIPNTFSILKQWLYILADGYSSYILKSIKNRTGRFSLRKEIISRCQGKPTITKELLIQILLMNLIKPKLVKINSFITKIEKERNLYHHLCSNGVFIMPTCKTLSLKHGKMNKKINSGKLGIISGAIFGNIMNLCSITVPAPKYRDKRTSLVPAIMLSTKPGNEALLFYVAEKLELLLN